MIVFIIMPFITDSQPDIKIEIIDKIFKKYNIKYSTGIKDGNGNFDIVETLKICQNVDYYIADVSYERPSCYYEIGYVQALGIKGDILAMTNTIIHQLVGYENAKFYANLSEFENFINEFVFDLQQSLPENAS